MKKLAFLAILGFITVSSFAAVNKKIEQKGVLTVKVEYKNNKKTWYVQYTCPGISAPINVGNFNSYSAALDYLMDHPASQVCAALAP
jgi:hypothetical protein